MPAIFYELSDKIFLKLNRLIKRYLQVNGGIFQKNSKCFIFMTEENKIIVIHDLEKKFLIGKKELLILKKVSLTIEKGESVAIVGPSGSGKTTFLGICAGLDQPSGGSINLLGQSLTNMSEDELADFRTQHIGFIFQNFQLMPNLTALENVLIPMELKKLNDKQTKALSLLDKVGLKDRAHHYPTQLSGGEQQRVAIARAFANEPSILFADEPTGNLDPETSELVESLLFDLNKTKQTTLLIITHDQALAKKAGRTLLFKNGVLIPFETRVGV